MKFTTILAATVVTAWGVAVTSPVWAATSDTSGQRTWSRQSTTNSGGTFERGTRTGSQTGTRSGGQAGSQAGNQANTQTRPRTGTVVTPPRVTTPPPRPVPPVAYDDEHHHRHHGHHRGDGWGRMGEGYGYEAPREPYRPRIYWGRWF